MRKYTRIALVLTAVMLLASFAGVAQALPPAPDPLLFFNGVCLGWTGETDTFTFGGITYYIWWYNVYDPECPIGPENFNYSDSVQGRFVENTQLLASPDASQGIKVVMELGKTAWIHGVDSTGSFFQISVGAAKAWVPVSSMAPNFDAPWNGAPLVVPVID